MSLGGFPGTQRDHLMTPMAGASTSARAATERVRSYLAGRRSLEETWFFHILFTRGHQWSYLDPVRGGITLIPRDPTKVRLTYNQVRPAMRRLLALVAGKMPAWQATTRGAEEDDFLAAQGYQALLAYDWERLRLSSLWRRSAMCALITGNAFWRVAWNPDAGDPIGVPVPHGGELSGHPGAPTNNQAVPVSVDDPFNPNGAATPLFSGDVDITHVSPFSFGVSPYATDLDRAEWCFQVAYVSRERLIDQYGSKAKTLPTADLSSSWLDYERQLRFDQSHESFFGGLFPDDDKDTPVRLVEMWEAPTKKAPEGRVISFVEDTVLDERPNPYGGRFPFVHFRVNEVEGRFWGDGFLRDCIDPQVALNQAMSKYHQIMMLTANPKWIADKTSGLKANSVNEQPGEVIFKRVGTQVIPVPAPAAPSIHPQIVGMATNAIQTSTGVNDVLAGDNPPNVRAAGALRELREVSTQAFGPISQGFADSLSQAGRLIMYLHRRFYTTDRVIAVTGTATGMPEAYHLRRADVDRILDVSVAQGSLLPRSLASQAETVVQLLQFAPQIFADQAGKMDTGAVLRLLEVPTSSGRTFINAAQRARISQEHIDVLDPRTPLVVQPYDNDVLHMQDHASRLSDEAWTRAHPEAALNLIAHYAQHEGQIVRKRGGEMVDIHGPSAPTDTAAPPMPLPAPSGARSPASRAPG